MTSLFFQEFKTFTTQISHDTNKITQKKPNSFKDYHDSAWLLNNFNTRIENLENQLDDIKNNSTKQEWSFENLF